MANKTEELRELDINGLVQARAGAKAPSFKRRSHPAVGQLDNTSRLREVRRQIARINTVLREKEIAAAEAGETT